MDIPDPHSVQEEFGPGIIREWLYGGKIMAITAESSTKETVDLWTKALSETIEQWPDDRPYLVLIDTSKSVLTPYVRQQAMHLASLRPDLDGRAAIVVAATTIGQLTRFFVTNRLNQANPTRERRVFFTRETALAWLEAAMQ
ncbi:MAG: hypothetical protein GYB66_02640 [Chloroflexi bacterium]|nr:hypothetical protein [Chloroflexota bacterium]